MAPERADRHQQRGEPHIPDYLIYDEIKRRREREAWTPERLEVPLYRPEPELDRPPPEPDVEDETPERGVMIIDMIDWADEDEEADDDEDDPAR